ncbi:MAG: hypothetical protein M3N38_12930 [Pseudomonadota bacterium]|nr:hypothetical protein [Pseudomonadota bacterium]
MTTAEPRYESPETLKRLQQLFDEIWTELLAAGSPHTAPEVAVAARDRLAVLVVKHVATSGQDTESIKREILAAFGAPPPEA